MTLLPAVSLLLAPMVVGTLAGAEPADLVVSHTHVITVNAQAPTAEAFAVRDGRFVAVGKASEVAAFIGTATKVVELRRR